MHVFVAEIPEGFLKEGDIYGAKNERNAITDTTYFWPSTTVPIAFDPALNLMVSLVAWHVENEFIKFKGVIFVVQSWQNLFVYAYTEE